MDIEQIKRFINNPLMSQAVYKVLLGEFLKKGKDRDVHNLASSKIAIELLQDAWKEIERHKTNNEVEQKVTKQVGM